MLCEECHQREAIVTFMAVDKGVTITRHLCMECVMQEGSAFASRKLQQIIAQTMKQCDAYEALPISPRKKDPDHVTCPSCGLTLGEYRKTGLLGCKECYHAFAGEIEENLEKIALRHIEFDCNPANNHKEKLQQKLAAAISEERYEDAAALRDELNQLASPEEGKA